MLSFSGMLNTVLAVATGIAVGLLIALVGFLLWKSAYTKSIRQDAIQRSQAVTVGKVVEQLIPYLPDFPFNPKDARFLGSPVDFVVFDGLDRGELRGIVFVEVKTGAATLTSRERQIREVIQARRVAWTELRVADKT